LKAFIDCCLVLLICFSSAIGEDQPLETTSTHVTNLKVQVTNLKADQGGQLIVLLFMGKETWLESNLEQSKILRPISPNTDLIFEFKDLLPSESYAVQIIHDKNKNGKMDFQWFPPKPAEGTGVSNNMMRLGPPAYESAEINLSAELTTLTISLVY